MKVVVTGANGFIGKNLIVQLAQRDEIEILPFTRDQTAEDLRTLLSQADFVYHLAGINRPEIEEEFETGNVGLTRKICDTLRDLGRAVPILFTSSTQIERDNRYGQSKLAAEKVLSAYQQGGGAPVLIYRLTNVFGKWCRPNYNSVVATFCHNIARGLPITISKRDHVLNLVYIDDVIGRFVAELEADLPQGLSFCSVAPVHTVKLGALADLIEAFAASRDSLVVPNMADPLVHKLYSTYLSYLEGDRFAYDLTQRCDPRGCLAEFVKSEPFGQIFVSRTVPGITRGNHYHHLKTEKFLVLEGEGIVRFRHILTDELLEYPVKGTDFRVIDIPPGWTHSIENVGSGELITLFWASEIFNPDRPDTVYTPVIQ